MPRSTVDPIVVPYIATVAAGTTIAVPATFNPGLPAGKLERIELQIPPGHVGLTGIRFTHSGQQIVPWSNTIAWINGDNLDLGLPIDLDQDGQLRIVAYNLGSYPHAFMLRFTIRQLAATPAPSRVTLIDNNRLSQEA